MGKAWCPWLPRPYPRRPLKNVLLQGIERDAQPIPHRRARPADDMEGFARRRESVHMLVLRVIVVRPRRQVVAPVDRRLQPGRRAPRNPAPDAASAG
jgi:hypothetical protein